jgi:hypothetical protein
VRQPFHHLQGAGRNARILQPCSNELALQAAGDRLFSFVNGAQCAFKNAHGISPAEQRCVRLGQLRNELWFCAMVGDRQGFLNSLACESSPDLEMRPRCLAE